MDWVHPVGRESRANKFYIWQRPYHDTRRRIEVLIFIRICLVIITVRKCANKGSLAYDEGRVCFFIIIGRLQSRRLRASSSHNDPVPIQTACPGQSCCLCLPKGVECIWETGFVAFLVFSSHVVEYTVRTPCMAHHQASWVHDPETSVGGFWHFLLAGQSELDHEF